MFSFDLGLNVFAIMMIFVVYCGLNLRFYYVFLGHLIGMIGFVGFAICKFIGCRLVAVVCCFSINFANSTPGEFDCPSSPSSADFGIDSASLPAEATDTSWSTAAPSASVSVAAVAGRASAFRTAAAAAASVGAAWPSDLEIAAVFGSGRQGSHLLAGSSSRSTLAESDAAVSGFELVGALSASWVGDFAAVTVFVVGCQIDAVLALGPEQMRVPPVADIRLTSSSCTVAAATAASDTVRSPPPCSVSSAWCSRNQASSNLGKSPSTRYSPLSVSTFVHFFAVRHVFCLYLEHLLYYEALICPCCCLAV